MTCQQQWTCPGCGDRMIHQWNRQPHESSSAFGQWVHDHVTRRTTIADVDCHVTTDVTFDGLQQLHLGLDTLPVFRHLEHKKPGQQISTAQARVVEHQSYLLALGASKHVISERSALFVVEAEPPFESFTVTRRNPRSQHVTRHMTSTDFAAWLGGEV